MEPNRASGGLPDEPRCPDEAEEVSDGRVSGVSRRARDVRLRIAAAGGDPELIRIIAVTKGFGVDVARSAVMAGLVDLGENYAQELLTKASALEPLEVLDCTPGPAAPSEQHLRWHLLGPIQRRTVRGLVGVVDLWHTVRREAEIDSLARALKAVGPGLGGPAASGVRPEVLVQVETTGLPGRSGCAPSEVEALVRLSQARQLPVVGLMTIAAPGGGDEARRSFALAASIARDLGLEQLSMGMSDDLEIAVEQGATMVRVGRALFGPRAL